MLFSHKIFWNYFFRHMLTRHFHLQNECFYGEDWHSCLYKHNSSLTNVFGFVRSFFLLSDVSLNLSKLSTLSLCSSREIEEILENVYQCKLFWLQITFFEKQTADQFFFLIPCSTASNATSNAISNARKTKRFISVTHYVHCCFL